jgi:hypothetical protein
MKQAKPGTLVLVQSIYVRWSKASRGAPGAAARNRVPEVHVLPANPPSTSWPGILVETRPESELWLMRLQAPEVLPPPDPAHNRVPDVYLHYVTYDERNQFRDPVAQWWFALASRLPEPCMLRFHTPLVPSLTLAGANDKLQLRFPWSYEDGAPRRSSRHLREQVLLATDQWLQMCFNSCIYADGLLGYGGTRYYMKQVHNIGIADALVPTMFVARPPDYQIADLADLR